MIKHMVITVIIIIIKYKLFQTPVLQIIVHNILIQLQGQHLLCEVELELQGEPKSTSPIGRVKFLISPTYSYGGATATRARVTHLRHLPLMEHGVLMVKVVMKSVVIISR